MTITLTPEPYNVFNELDEQGVLLALSRLKKERNAAYKQRLLDVMVNRASSTYEGLINGITRELGLKIIDTLLIEPVLDVNSDPLVASPAVVFQETKVRLYNDYMADDILLEIDRFEPLDNAYTIENLVSVINDTGFYTATILANVEPNARSMTVFNQSSIGIVPAEDISDKGLRIRLDNINLIAGTISVSSSNLLTRKSSSLNLRPGEYFIDESAGIIISSQVPASGSFIRYKYRNDNLIVKSSPVIIHNLQSVDFKTKMFTQIGNEEPQNGLPTHLGADLIAELLSVFPSLWGP